MATKRARRGYHLVPCDGDAHSNPFIDHCGTCMPRWGWVEIPRKYATLADWRARDIPLKELLSYPKR